MKKVKIALWLILIVVIVLLFFQNKEFFKEPQSFVFNPYITSPYTSPALPHAVWFLGCFMVGLLIAYFFSLMQRFKSNRIIKDLRAKNESLLDLISQLRKELELRSTHKEAVSEEPSVVDVEPVSDPQPNT
ncbi:MAG: hypothetical protein RBT11_12460 [Desulfobacterales bacterium]|jgi:hypothetical protein|nr:hypothetical protein [Desulfobacterales bacterium]